jgi:hypothetical protein
MEIKLQKTVRKIGKNLHSMKMRTSKFSVHSSCNERLFCHVFVRDIFLKSTKVYYRLRETFSVEQPKIRPGGNREGVLCAYSYLAAPLEAHVFEHGALANACRCLHCDDGGHPKISFQSALIFAGNKSSVCR